MTTQKKVEQVDSTLFADYANIELRLEIAISLQSKLKQASIWTFNAWCETDALLEREKSKELIDRLEQQSIKADELKAEVDTIVKDLRTAKRKLTKKLKSKVFSPEAKAELSKVNGLINDQTKAIADKFQVDKKTAKKPQLKIVKSENVNKSKAKTK